jgi:hypothetical protein
LKRYFMGRRITREIVLAVIVTLVVAALSLSWNWFTGGGLVRSLGGATQIKSLSLLLAVEKNQRSGEVIVPLDQKIKEEAYLQGDIDGDVAIARQVTYIGGEPPFGDSIVYQVSIREWLVEDNNSGADLFELNTSVLPGPQLKITWKTSDGKAEIQELNVLVLSE